MDGHKFIPQAVEKGAVAILTEKEITAPAGAAVLRVENLKEALETMKRGIEVISEIELAWRLAKAPIYAVTGTNGKTTTVTLLGLLLETLHKKVGVGGNIGIPLCDEVMDKAASKRVFLGAGISTPRSRTYHRFEMECSLQEIRQEFSLPVVVKAASQGSSIGVVIVEKPEDLKAALEEAFKYDDEVLVEEFIQGKELTVAVWGNEEKKEAFPIIEITTASGRYDYDSKYTKGASTHIIPARVSDELTKKIQQLAIDTFTACSCRGVARVDMMLSEAGVPYVIEVNSVPGMVSVSALRIFWHRTRPLTFTFPCWPSMGSPRCSSCCGRCIQR